MYEQSRHLATFFVAGFQYWDGSAILGDLKCGEAISLRPEPDNPHDPNAVALYAKGTKLGYLPANENQTLSTLLHFGHADAMEARILQVNPENDPWNQVRIGIYAVDARSTRP